MMFILGVHSSWNLKLISLSDFFASCFEFTIQHFMIILIACSSVLLFALTYILLCHTSYTLLLLLFSQNIL